MRADAKILRLETADGAAARPLGFSPDGARVVTDGRDGVARIYDATTGKPLAEMRGHTGNIVFATFSGDGTKLLTGSNDRTARVWDAATGDEILTLRGHSAIVTSGTFSGDGEVVLTTSADKTARTWPVDVVRAAATRAVRDPTDEERRRYEIR